MRLSTHLSTNDSPALSRLAAAYIASGQPEQTAITGHTALPVARGAGSNRIVDEIKNLSAELTLHCALPAVVALLDDLDDGDKLNVASQREMQAMRLAIALSAHGLGTTSPNPPVGCVILSAHGEIIGTGYHQRKGESHAEVHALTAAGRRAHAGTAVVTP